jgi:hypothetical protein
MDNTSSPISNSQHHTEQKQKQKQARKRKQNSNLNDQNNISGSLASQNDDESSIANRPPLNDATNSVSTLHQTKRRRRI